MRVLLIGGSGYLGNLLLPYLGEHHTIRILDRRPPRSPVSDAVEQILGDATDPTVLRAAMSDVDVLIHCAMAEEEVVGSFDVNVKSVHVSLLAAHEAGVPHAVHISSMSVYRDLLGRTLDGSEPPDATDIYGLTKRLGEQVCQAAVAEWGLSVTSLRLMWPTADADWPDWTRHGLPQRLFTTDGVPVEPTAASDLAAAVLAALDYRDGYQIFTISGDRSARRWSIERAERLLGWRPRFTPTR